MSPGKCVPVHILLINNQRCSRCLVYVHNIIIVSNYVLTDLLRLWLCRCVPACTRIYGCTPLGMTKWTCRLNTKFWRSNLHTKVTHITSMATVFMFSPVFQVAAISHVGVTYVHCIIILYLLLLFFFSFFFFFCLRYEIDPT